MVLNVLEDTNTTNVVTAGHEDGGTVLELADGVDVSGLKVKLLWMGYKRGFIVTYLDAVVDLDVGVGETDGTAVVGHNVGDLVLADLLLGNLAKLEASLLSINSVGLEAALNVVEHAEVLAGLLNGNNVHEAEGEPMVLSLLVVDLDVGGLVLADLHALLVGESVLKSVLEEDAKGKAFTELVGAGRGAGSVNALELIKAPGGGSEHALKMLFGSTSLQVTSRLANHCILGVLEASSLGRVHGLTIFLLR